MQNIKASDDEIPWDLSSSGKEKTGRGFFSVGKEKRSTVLFFFQLTLSAIPYIFEGPKSTYNLNYILITLLYLTKNSLH